MDSLEVVQKMCRKTSIEPNHAQAICQTIQECAAPPPLEEVPMYVVLKPEVVAAKTRPINVQ